MTVRDLCFKLHMYAGLAAGALLVLAGLTGSALVFRPQLDSWLHPELVRVEPGAEHVPLQRVLDAARAAHPERRLETVQLPRAPHETVEVTSAGPDPVQIYVDPYRSTVVGSRRTTESLPNVLFELHVDLMAGTTGELLLGGSAVLLALLCVTGIVVWWPRWTFWDGFRVKWTGNWKRANYDLHGATGIWTLAFLLVIAVTGASLVFHDAFMAGLNRATGSEPRPTVPAVEPAAAAPMLPLDSLVARADAALPAGTSTYITLPTAPDAPVVVRKHQASELHPNGRSFVYLHPGSGRVLALENALEMPKGTRYYNSFYPLHIGRWGGLASRLLYAVLGLAPVVLFGSGIVMWWNRTRPRRGRR